MRKRIESGHQNPQLCFRATRVSNWVPTKAGFGRMSEVDVGVLGADVGWLGAAQGIVVCAVVWQLGAWREVVAGVECRMMK